MAQKITYSYHLERLHIQTHISKEGIGIGGTHEMTDQNTERQYLAVRHGSWSQRSSDDDSFTIQNSERVSGNSLKTF